jgi:hypothetical protein
MDNIIFNFLNELQQIKMAILIATLVRLYPEEMRTLISFEYDIPIMIQKLYTYVQGIQ